MCRISTDVAIIAAIIIKIFVVSHDVISPGTMEDAGYRNISINVMNVTQGMRPPQPQTRVHQQPMSNGNV